MNRTVEKMQASGHLYPLVDKSYPLRGSVQFIDHLFLIFLRYYHSYGQKA